MTSLNDTHSKFDYGSERKHKWAQKRSKSKLSKLGKLAESHTGSLTLLDMAEMDGRDRERSRRINRLRLFEKLVYVLVLAVLVIFLIVQTAQCLINFYNEPTYTETQIVKQNEAEFPAATFCAERNGVKADVLEVSQSNNSFSIVVQ